LEKEKKKRLTDAQKAEITAALGRGVSVKDLAEKYHVTQPTIYAIKKAPRQADPLTAVVKAEIETAEARVAELEKSMREIDWLREKIKLKKDFVAALEKIEERK
jgi:transposase-like protein